MGSKSVLGLNAIGAEVGAGDGVGAGEGVAGVAGVGLTTTTPLFQTNFLPDLMQVYVFF